MRNILCYGDSNTWGFMPADGHRYPENVRWTGRLQALFGKEAKIIEEGLNGRTTVFDDPMSDYQNGLATLTAVLISQKPLDAVVFSLGTNDLKFVGAWDSAAGMGRLIRETLHVDGRYPSAEPVFRGKPRILVISPIEVDDDLGNRAYDRIAPRRDESKHFAEAYASVCSALGVEFLDGAKLARPSLKDCVHMDPEGHAALAEAVYAKLREMLGNA